MTRTPTRIKSPKQQKQHTQKSKPAIDQPTTVAGHLNELKNRLFWVAMVFVVASATVYPFFDQVIKILTAPLAGESLHYFTPAGGLGFIIKICMYLGFIGALPAFVYHLYRFVQPVMNHQRKTTLISYTLASVVLAIAGVVFAYVFILPTAIGFLTSFAIEQVNPLLSADSYISFVIAYIITGALLFQVPLLMLMMNRVTPLPPAKLLSFERYVIVGAFIIGALLSPTPDVVNQLLIAGPLIVMYQIGFALIIAKNYTKNSKLAADEPAEEESVVADHHPGLGDEQQPRPRSVSLAAEAVPKAVPKVAPIDAARNISKPVQPVRSLDGVMPARRSRTVKTSAARPRPPTIVPNARPVRTRSDLLRNRQLQNLPRSRSVDGFGVYSYPN